MITQVVCACGVAACLHFELNHPWCRACDEHHRPPECAVDEQGRSLASCGHPWDADPCTEVTE